MCLSFPRWAFCPEDLCGPAWRPTCVGTILCVFRWCFTLSGLTYLSGETFPGNRHIPQTALECFYRMAPGTLQGRFCLWSPAKQQQHCHVAINTSENFSLLLSIWYDLFQYYKHCNLSVIWLFIVFMFIPFNYSDAMIGSVWELNGQTR